MELSENTLNILRNFSGINQNILIKADSPIKTISEARNVVARADIPEKFLKDFGIYDLNEFIGVTGLVNSPSLHFNDDFVMISDESGRSSVKYFYSAAETLTTPTKDVSMPEPDVKFTLDNSTLNKLKKVISKKDVSMASADDVKAQTGFTIGGVSPVGHINELNMIIDRTLERFQIVYAAAGHPNSIFEINFSKLKDLTKGSIEDITE